MTRIMMYYLLICFASLTVADSGNFAVCITVFLFKNLDLAATIRPDSLNVSLNSISTFTCSSFGASFLFFTIDKIPVAQGVNAGRGLNEGIQKVINRTRYRILTIEAKVINNNTNISCIRLPGETTAEPALLKIQGNKQCNVSI